jgi:putative ABC transport system permease protein
MGLILKYSLRNLWRDRRSLLANMALLVAAVVAYIVFPMMGKTALKTMKSYGTPDKVLIMEKDNLKLAFSRVEEDLYEFVKTAPHVAMDGEEALVSPYLQMSSIHGDKFLMLRGIDDVFYKVKGPSFKIIEGKRLEDKYDILIGHLLPRRLGRECRVGDSITLEGRDWRIAGIFRAKGDPVEAGALVRMEDFREVSARSTYSFIELRADSTENVARLMRYVNMAFDALHAEFPDAPAIMAIQEKRYWSRLASMSKMAVMLGRARAGVIVISVFLTLMNVSNAYLMRRSSEIRVFAYHGIGRPGLFSGILLEALVVSAAAGVIGSLLAMTFSGMAINLQWSTVVLKIGYSVLPGGLVLAVVLGVLACVFPALKLARVS